MDIFKGKFYPGEFPFLGLDPEKGLAAAVTGVVKSENGQPLSGASVNIRKLKKSGMTDENGEFVLRDVPNGEYEVAMALEGRVPGLYIAQASGLPGAAYRIKLRRQNSTTSGNDPLYIVDGVPFTAITLSSPYVYL